MTVTCTVEGAVAEVRMDRPDKLNSLGEAMVADFHAALDQVGDARAVLVTAAGRAFSAGRDLSDAEPLTEDAEAILRDTFNPLLLRIAELDVPTIAAVQGACLGVGFGIAFACDLVVAADDAKVGSPFARIGAVLDSGAHRYLVERIGPHRALELIYTGRLLSGEEAAAIGLVNRVGAGRRAGGRRRGRWRCRSRPDRRPRFAESKRIVRAMAAGPASLTVRCSRPRARRRAASPARPTTPRASPAFQDKRTPTFTGR